MLAFVRVELSAGVEDVSASGPDAVDVVAHFGEAAPVEVAVLVLHELLEAVPVQLLVFDVVALVLLCHIHNNATLSFRVNQFQRKVKSIFF